MKRNICSRLLLRRRIAVAGPLQRGSAGGPRRRSPAPKVVQVEKLKDNLCCAQEAAAGISAACSSTPQEVVVGRCEEYRVGVMPILDKIRGN